MGVQALSVGRLRRGATVFAACAALLAPIALSSAGCGKVTSTDIPNGKVDETSLTLFFGTKNDRVKVQVNKSLTLEVSVLDANNNGADGQQVQLVITEGGGSLDPQVVVTSGGLATSTFNAPGEVGTTRIRATFRDQNKEIPIEIIAEPTDDGGGGSGDDEIDLSQVAFLHQNVSKWKVKTKITRASARKPEVCFVYNSSDWPVYGDCRCIVGNPWIVKQVNGRWYAATWEWLRKGVVCKHPEGDWYTGILRQTKVGPLNSSRISSGEEVGLFVSTWARTPPPSTSPAWRTNVVKVRWDQ